MQRYVRRVEGLGEVTALFSEQPDDEAAVRNARKCQRLDKRQTTRGFYRVEELSLERYAWDGSDEITQYLETGVLKEEGKKRLVEVFFEAPGDLIARCRALENVWEEHKLYRCTPVVMKA